MTIDRSEELIAKLCRQCRKYTDRLFLQDHFLGSGHDDGTHNGTATFIKYGGHHYVCTCHHVAEAIGNEAIRVRRMSRLRLSYRRDSPR